MNFFIPPPVTGGFFIVCFAASIPAAIRGSVRGSKTDTDADAMMITFHYILTDRRAIMEVINENRPPLLPDICQFADFIVHCVQNIMIDQHVPWRDKYEDENTMFDPVNRSDILFRIRHTDGVRGCGQKSRGGIGDR